MGQLQKRDDETPDESLPGGALTLDECRRCSTPMVLLGPRPAEGPLCPECATAP